MCVCVVPCILYVIVNATRTVYCSTDVKHDKVFRNKYFAQPHTILVYLRLTVARGASAWMRGHEMCGARLAHGARGCAAAACDGLRAILVGSRRGVPLSLVVPRGRPRADQLRGLLGRRGGACAWSGQRACISDGRDAPGVAES